MRNKIEVVMNIDNKEKARELMEDSLVQIIVDRINKYPEYQHTYIYNKILDELNES
ncbi:MAG: hypothetical protein N4A48_11795 [Tepidibacter sp.]|jgi:hypothetical protein|uniref:hypothetical protein n=1 Tax=Tepidibacter sp. TaxID=2529387 RepID=UPI0025EB1D75|nr:hypothetical protein [Tepidibacter sp.]MCT4509412.1 hypothetical protein [Tepidibacter sp.]